MLNRLRFVGIVLGLILIFFVSLATLALAEPHVWGPRVGAWYTAPSSTPQSDAIIVLGGNTYERIGTGIDLLQSGAAPQIAITGHNPDNPDDWEAQGLKSVLASAGMRENDAIWLETRSTFEDAQRIAEQVQTQGWQRILIVSHWYHGRRAICTIKNVIANDDVQIAFAPAATDINLTNWWRFEDGISSLFTETAKLPYYNLKHGIPLGDCWGEGMAPIKIVGLSTLGVPLSYLLVVAIRHYAVRKQKLDIPNRRSSHIIPTPRGGGVAVVIVTTTLLLLGAFDEADIPIGTVLAFVTAGVGVAGIGLTDDWWRPLSAKMRLGLHFVVALVLVAASDVMLKLYLPILGDLDLGLVLGGALTVFWIIGLINAFNFMDGSDGLAGTQAFLGGSAWAILFFLEGHETLALLAALLAAGSLGFLVLNAPPARIFMGDVGSTFLGFSLSALGVLGFAETGDPRLPITSALIVGVFIFDTMFTILRRARNGENLLEAHCSHLYQRLIRAGYPHGKVCIRYALLMAISAAGGLAYYFTESEVLALGVLFGVLGLYLGLVGWVAWLETNHTPSSKP